MSNETERTLTEMIPAQVVSIGSPDSGDLADKEKMGRMIFRCLDQRVADLPDNKLSISASLSECHEGVGKWEGGLLKQGQSVYVRRLSNDPGLTPIFQKAVNSIKDSDS